MIPSPNPTTSPRTRQRFVDDAYNEREHAVLKLLRQKDPEDYITSFEDLAARTGLSVDETNRTMVVLLKRRVVCVVNVTGDYGPSHLVIQASRVEKPAF